MPTISRIDYGFASGHDADGVVNGTGPTQIAYGKLEIESQRLFNIIDAKVAELAGVTSRCLIDYYGDQCQAGSIAVVKFNGRKHRIEITEELLEFCKRQCENSLVKV